MEKYSRRGAHGEALRRDARERLARAQRAHAKGAAKDMKLAREFRVLDAGRKPREQSELIRCDERAYLGSRRIGLCLV
jgi:hypothetical protein